jgi:cytochrome d ubiquinol oxidase subunit I
MTAELGRQPWLVYGLHRTAQGTSPYVSGGNIAFSALGFMGMYALLTLLFLYLIMREISRGPQELPAGAMGPGGGEESGESSACPLRRSPWRRFGS